MKPVNIENIKVGGEIGRRIDITAVNNILKLDLEKDFLRPFRGNWDFRKQGDFFGLGKLIDAITRLAAYSKDEKMMKLRSYIIDTTISLQGGDGYIGVMKPEDRMKNLWDVHEMSFIILGLAADYRYWKEERSLNAAGRLADFLTDAWMKNPSELPDFVDLCTLGVENALIALYELTGERKYLEFLDNHLDPSGWNREIVIGRWGKISGHIYDYLDKTLAHMKMQSICGRDDLSGTVQRLIDFIFNKDGMVITGHMGDYECWTDSQEGTNGLGETCATAYFLFFLDELLKRTGNPFYGDAMERVIYNALFPAQSPDGRKVRYYTAFEGKRGYFNPDNYCCPGNYRRAISRLPEMVYYLDDDGLIVNLYTASETAVYLQDGIKLSICQKTDYPASGKVIINLNLSAAKRFSLKLRIPGWCKKAEVMVNSERVTSDVQKGRFLIIDRLWNEGDAVELDMPMDLRLIKGRKQQHGKAAVMRGPVVFCLNRSKHPELAGKDLRLITLNTSTLKGPLSDDTIHEGGQACQINTWAPDSGGGSHQQPLVHYPLSPADNIIRLTEFADPDGEAIYFKLPNPCGEELENDELTGFKIGSR